MHQFVLSDSNGGVVGEHSDLYASAAVADDFVKDQCVALPRLSGAAGMWVQEWWENEIHAERISTHGTHDYPQICLRQILNGGHGAHHVEIVLQSLQHRSEGLFYLRLIKLSGKSAGGYIYKSTL